MKTVKVFLMTCVCLLMLSCSGSGGSYDVFPMLVVTTPGEYSGEYSFQLLSREGELTPIEIPDENKRDYHGITPFSADGAAVVMLSGDDEKRFYIVYRDGSDPVEITTDDGSEIYGCSAFSEGIAIVESQGMRTGINTKGETLWTVDETWSISSPFVNGKALVEYGLGEYGVINVKGEEIATFQGNNHDEYDICSAVCKDWIRYGLFGSKYEKNEGYGVMDFDMEYVVEPEYSEEIRIEDKDRFVVCQNKKYGVVDREGNEILPFEYGAISIDGELYLAYKKDMGYAWIDKEGNEVISPKVSREYFHRDYLYMSRFYGSPYARLGNGHGRYILINREGEQVFEEKEYGVGLYFKSGEHYYFIDSSGNQYEHFVWDEEGNEIYNSIDAEEKIIDFGYSNANRTFINSEIDGWTMFNIA